jgi:hypothetical protein
MENVHDIFFENLLANLKEGQRKAVRAGALSPFRAFTTSKTPLCSKALSIQIASS